MSVPDYLLSYLWNAAKGYNRDAANGRHFIQNDNRGNLERAAGIEPASSAWKAEVLPLHNARSSRDCLDQAKVRVKLIVIAKAERYPEIRRGSFELTLRL